MQKAKTFDLKDYVPDIELCKKLKDLGFPQDGGGFYWDIGLTGRLYLCLYRKNIKDSFFAWDGVYRADVIFIDDDFYQNFVKAPTSGELLIYHPPDFKEEYVDGEFRIWNDKTNPSFIATDEKEVNAHAKLVIYLLEKLNKFTTNRR